MKIIIPGSPIALKRARTFLRHGKIQHVNSQKCEMDFLRFQLKKHLNAPFDCALSLELEFHMPIAAGVSKKKRGALNGADHTNKPDIDNLIKYVLDVGNEILWTDDSIICGVSAMKVHSLEPKTIITIFKKNGAGN